MISSGKVIQRRRMTSPRWRSSRKATVARRLRHWIGAAVVAAKRGQESSPRLFGEVVELLSRQLGATLRALTAPEGDGGVFDQIYKPAQ